MTTTPPLAPIMTGIWYFRAKNTPRRFVCRTSSHSLLRILVQRLLECDPRIVEGDIEASELRHREVDEPLHICLDAHISTEVVRRSAVGTNLLRSHR